jgi:hypothetical protein
MANMPLIRFESEDGHFYYCRPPSREDMEISFAAALQKVAEENPEGFYYQRNKVFREIFQPCLRQL